VTVSPITEFDGSEQWKGATIERSRWSIGPQTPLPVCLKRICYIIAGEIGEWVLDRDNYRNGTSLDEIALSQRMGGGAGRLERAPAVGFQQVGDELLPGRGRCLRGV
jgi:hypothetical protein